MTTHFQLEDSQPYASGVFTGQGAAVTQLRLQVARIAPHFRLALLNGEPGVGKHTVAQELHRLSPVAGAPFIVMDAADFAARPKPRKAGGTIYLRRLEALDSGSQSKLLGALKSIDRETRLIAASSRDLKGMVAARRMRQDLYECIGTLEIRVAPLRERLDDFDRIAKAMLHPTSFHPSAIERMRHHSWPGNLDELWQFCEKLSRSGNVIAASDLPPLAVPGVAGSTRLEEVMRRHVMDVLQNCSGNKLRAAELLGISRSTLYRMLDSGPTEPAQYDRLGP